jgi:hypothetical protein
MHTFTLSFKNDQDHKEYNKLTSIPTFSYLIAMYVLFLLGASINVVIIISKIDKYSST